MVKVAAVHPKKRLLGLALLSVMMIFIGMVLRQEAANNSGGAIAAPGFVGLLWFVILWNSISGRVDLIKKWALIAIVVQALAGLFLAYVSQDPSVAMMNYGSSSSDVLVETGIPLALWIIVYFRAKSVLEGLPIEVQRSLPNQMQDQALEHFTESLKQLRENSK